MFVGNCMSKLSNLLPCGTKLTKPLGFFLYVDSTKLERYFRFMILISFRPDGLLVLFSFIVLVFQFQWKYYYKKEKIFIITEINPCCMSIHLFSALNEKLKEEVERLKIASGQIQSVNGNPFGRGLPPQFAPQHRHHLGTHLTQQQQQRNMPQSSSNNGQPSHLSFMDFNQRV